MLIAKGDDDVSVTLFIDAATIGATAVDEDFVAFDFALAAGYAGCQ